MVRCGVDRPPSVIARSTPLQRHQAASANRPGMRNLVSPCALNFVCAPPGRAWLRKAAAVPHCWHHVLGHGGPTSMAGPLYDARVLACELAREQPITSQLVTARPTTACRCQCSSLSQLCCHVRITTIPTMRVAVQRTANEAHARLSGVRDRRHVPTPEVISTHKGKAQLTVNMSRLVLVCKLTNWSVARKDVTC